LDQEENPTAPAENVTGAPRAQEESTTDHPRVRDLLAAARGDVSQSEGTPAPATRTIVTPSARAASSGTTGDAVAPGDVPNKEVPSSTPSAARVAPNTGASKTTSTPTASVNKGVTKAVAAKPPAAGPVVQSAPEPSINKLRRRIVWASIASFLGVSFLMFLRFFLPRTIMEPSSVFRIGFPGDYSFGVDTKWQQQHRIWVVKNSERLFVIFAKCTHLGCTPDWKASENKFKCPCHGSGYDSEGVNFEGPAPRPMDRAKVEMDAEGQVVVDTSKLFDSPKGGQSRFDDPGAFIRV